jgi:hypothetical protein
MNDDESRIESIRVASATFYLKMDGGPSGGKDV